jgi:hypothetical protein
MQRRDAKLLAVIGAAIMRFTDPLATMLAPNMELVSEERERWLSVLKNISRMCVGLHLHDSAAVADCLVDEYDNDRRRTLSDLRASVEYFSKSFYAELDRHIFLQLDPDRGEYLRTLEAYASSSDPSLVSNFSSAVPDFAEAGICYAVHRHTACVFHCMRAAEKGLRALAVDLQVPFKVPFEYENWQNVIEMAEKAIRGLEQTLPKGVSKSEKLQFYSEAATQFFYFKNAWRNHVAHARDSYDAVQAKTILAHVEQFMNHLAKGGLHD